MSKGKGSQYERDICRKLSLWWTQGLRDDVFWRTSNSGGRSTIRAKTGKKTFGQYGDVQATDPIGQPLMDYSTIEIKRGYSKASIMDIIDKPKNGAVPLYEKFIQQAIEEHKQAGSKTWWLIIRRDRKDALLFYEIKNYTSWLCSSDPCILIRIKGKLIGIEKLDSFLERSMTFTDIPFEKI